MGRTDWSSRILVLFNGVEHLWGWMKWAKQNERHAHIQRYALLILNTHVTAPYILLMTPIPHTHQLATPLSHTHTHTHTHEAPPEGE